MMPPRKLLPIGPAMALALAACGPAAVKPPTTVDVTVQAATDVNPDPAGRPSPVAVALYELRAAGRFSAADFLSLHEQPEKALGSDLVRREEVVLAPGETRSITLAFQPGSRHLGVAGGYRRFGEARWRAQVTVPEGGTSRVRVGADRLAIRLEQAGP